MAVSSIQERVKEGSQGDSSSQLSQRRYHVRVPWFLISVMLDLVMFLPESPMRMDIVNYVKDIGLTYLMIPTITIGFGYPCEKR